MSSIASGQTLSRVVQVRFTDAQWRALAILARGRGHGISESVRQEVQRGLDKFVDEDGRTLVDRLEEDPTIGSDELRDLLDADDTPQS